MHSPFLMVAAAAVSAALVCALLYGMWRLESHLLTRHTERRAERVAYLRALDNADFWRTHALALYERLVEERQEQQKGGVSHA